MTAYNTLRRLTFVAILGYPQAVGSIGGIFWLTRWLCCCWFHLSELARRATRFECIS